MKSLFSIFFPISVFIFISCQTLFEPANPSDLYGHWIYSTSIDSVQVFYYANDFERDKSGIAFKKDNIFVERTSGFCATPPLSFFNIEGKWKRINENQIEIFTQNWNNEDYSRIMKIISHTGNELRVIFYY